MTTIVGVHTQNVVAIVSDTLVTTDHDRVGTFKKLVILDRGGENETCVAIAGSVTSALAFRAVVEEHEFEHLFDNELNVYRNMLMVHSIMRDHHGLITKEQDDDKWESSQLEALIGSRHGLFRVFSTREVVKLKMGAIGSGRDFALGALSAIGVNHPETSLRRAMQVASAYDKDTGGDHMDIWEIACSPS